MMRPVLLVLLVLAASVPAFAAAGPASAEALPSASRDLDGRLRDAYGLLAPPRAGDPASIADAWLAANAVALGLPGVDGLELAHAKRSLTATHLRYVQTHDGLPVAGGDVSVHVRHDGAVVAVHSRAIERALPLAAPIPAADAVRAARAAAEGDLESPPRLVLLADGAVGVPAWEVPLLQPLPLSAPLVHVDARDGSVLRVANRVHAATAETRLWINPIVSSGNADLRDNRIGTEKTSDPTPNGAIGSRDYTDLLWDVELVDLEEGPRGPVLTGPRVHIVDALAAGADMRYPREDPRFEEVMAYYWMTWTQGILTDLGFPDLMAYQIPVYLHDQNGVFNAFYRNHGDGTGEIHFGWHAPTARLVGLPILPPSVPPGVPVASGFADSGEDGEVVVHEYAHAVLDNAVPNFNGGHMHEGFADFLAATMLSRFANGTFEWCIAEWFTSYIGTSSGGRPPCLRTLENDLTIEYPATGHALGQVWSGALWKIRNELGREAGERLVLEAIHFLPTDGSFHEGAEALLLADGNLNGAANARLIVEEFARRGITDLIVTEDLLAKIRAADARLASAGDAAATPLAVPAPALLLALGVPLALAALRRRA